MSGPISRVPRSSMSWFPPKSARLLLKPSGAPTALAALTVCIRIGGRNQLGPPERRTPLAHVVHARSRDPSGRHQARLFRREADTSSSRTSRPEPTTQVRFAILSALGRTAVRTAHASAVVLGLPAVQVIWTSTTYASWSEIRVSPTKARCRCASTTTHEAGTAVWSMLSRPSI